LRELVAPLGALDPLARTGPAQTAAGTMAGCAERPLHRALPPGEDEAGRSHAPRYEHRLTHLAILLRYLRIAGCKGARCAFAVHAKPAAVVALELGDVVRHVVHLMGPLRNLLA